MSQSIFSSTDYQQRLNAAALFREITIKLSHTDSVNGFVLVVDIEGFGPLTYTHGTLSDEEKGGVE